MRKNMGTFDRIIRLLIAVAIAVMYLTNVIEGTLGIILLVVAIIFAITSLISVCPIYSIFGFKTCPTKNK